jgi:hypothetical protein
MEAVCSSRDEVLVSTNLAVLIYWAGEFAGCLARLELETERAMARGQFARAARCWCFASSCQSALGRLGEARHSMEEARALAARVSRPIFNVLQSQENLAMVEGEGLEEVLSAYAPLTATVIPALAWALGFMHAASAVAAARLAQEQLALRHLSLVASWLERCPSWHVGFPILGCYAAETLWVLERLDQVALVEHAVLEKLIDPDFRAPMADGRLALARLCALQGRHDEAQKWLGEARRVLDEQGALPLLAIADYDESLMFVRRGGPRDAERARPLVEAARRQFEELGMTGWIRRADELTG